MSKKIVMLIGTILGNCLVIVLYNLWPDIPQDVLLWAIGGISSTGIGGVLGQGFADGLSRGLTSSQGKRIMDSRLEKNSSAPVEPQGAE
ncbi:MAG: hypothetical protein FVQ81_05400 [Candidatus Glassbacteria bacterium]|nr:hypothetical protein [Candidatus Glassbacteria bacterium]